MLKSSLNLATLLALAAMGASAQASAQASAPAAGRRGQPGLKNIVGPATNWPSGKIHRKARGDSGQHPKFKKARKHKQHVHPLRDEHGAYTLIGTERELPTIVGYDHNNECIVELVSIPKRKWLAGISAQRGY